MGDRELFWSLLDGGGTIVGAASAAGVNLATAYRWVHRAGCLTRRGRRRRSGELKVFCPDGRAPSAAARTAGLLVVDDRRVRAVELVRQGATLTGAARVVGARVATVSGWVRQAGVVPWTAAQRTVVARAVVEAARAEAAGIRQGLIEQAVGLVGGGSTVIAAARQVGVSEAAVRRFMHQAGIPVPKGVPKPVRERFWQLWRQGMSVAEAAAAAGVNPGTAARWVNAAGVARPQSLPPAEPAKINELLILLRSGVSTRMALEQVGVSKRVGYYWADRLAKDPSVSVGVFQALTGCDGQTGGVDVDMGAPRGFRLGVLERQEIAIGKTSGWTLAQIAARINRPKSTVSRELARNTSPDGSYRMLQAEQAARDRARRPKPAKLAQEGPLRDFVVTNLNGKQRLSPEQIAHRLVLEYPFDKEMRVCHETIYQAIYIQARGGLKREVEKALRQGRTYRKPHRREAERRGRIPGMIPISQRPADVEERLIPGDWEGDLIIGKDSASAVATLVERSFRYTMLGYLPIDHTAASVRDAIVPLLSALPDQLRRSLTWDQGSEMACHLQVAEQADIDVYFADPHSPWQRGTNENTNGLLRQYMPKGTDLSVYTADDLTEIAAGLNNRPRKTLGWLTPTEALHLALGHTVTIGGRPAKLPDTLKPLTQRCDDH